MWQLQKIADEGTAEPFIARLWTGVLDLRDVLFRHKTSSEADYVAHCRCFDDLYIPVLEALSSARQHSRAIKELIGNHRAKLASGSIVSYQQHAVQINESIGSSLHKEFSGFLSTAVRAAKLFQHVLSYLNVNVDFLFQKPQRFTKGLTQLHTAGMTELADYLDKTRSGWSDTLVQRRNNLEHEGWRLPDVRYIQKPSGVVTVIEPEVDGRPVTEFVSYMQDRLFAFVEELLAYAVQRGIAGFADVVEIPKEKRDPKNVIRFRVSVSAIEPEACFWRLRYNERGFQDS